MVIFGAGRPIPVPVSEKFAPVIWLAEPPSTGSEKLTVTVERSLTGDVIAGVTELIVEPVK
jgi:hypothetical protein